MVLLTGDSIVNWLIDMIIILSSHLI